MDFLYPLRILAERQLTRREIQLIQKGKPIYVPGDATIKCYQRDGNLVESYTQFFKSPNPISPLELCQFKRETRTYTADGRLTEISIEDNNGTRKKIKYDPPGRFVGKTQKGKKAA